MNTNNHAIVISSKGQTVHLGYVTMKRGCPDTRAFAESSHRFVTNRGVSLAIGEDATPEAIRKAIDLLSKYLPGFHPRPSLPLPPPPPVTDKSTRNQHKQP